MSALNKTAKFFGYLGIHTVVVIECYLLSMVYSAPVICVALSVIQLVTGKLPDMAQNRFWAFYLVVCIPAGVLYFIFIEKELVKRAKNRFKVK